MVKFNLAFCKNVWSFIHGMFWQLTMSVLAISNVSRKYTELSKWFGPYLNWIGPLYLLCQLTPLLKLWRYRLMWPGLSAGTGNFWQTIVISSRTSTWFAFEVSSRTQAVFGQQADEGAQSTRRGKRRIPVRTQFLLSFSEESERVGLGPLSESERQNLDRPRSCCGRRHGTLRERAKASAEHAKRMAASPRCFWKTLCIYLANPNIYVSHPHPSFPTTFVLSLKISLWSCLFHVLIYVLSVQARVIDWYSPTWVLKVLMSLTHLYSLRRASSVRSPWPLARFGVLEQDQSPWPLAELWQHWSLAAAQKFAWDAELNWWQLLQTGAIDPCRAPTILHTNLDVVGDTPHQTLMPQVK